MVMPRHFLVKRHTPVDPVMNQAEFDSRTSDQGSGGETPFTNINTAASTNGSAVACILNPDQHIILREDYTRNLYHTHHQSHQLHQHHLSEYTSHGSPDSGYAASPNSITHPQHRDKDSIIGPREHNNNNSDDININNHSHKVSNIDSSSSSLNNPYRMSHYMGGTNMFQSQQRYYNTYLHTGEISSANGYGNQLYLAGFARPHTVHCENEENVSEAPMDLSMPRKSSDSSSPPRLSPTEEESPKNQPIASPASREQVATTAESAAMMYLNHLRGRGFRLAQSPPHGTNISNLPSVPHRSSKQEATDSATSNSEKQRTVDVSPSNMDRSSCIAVPTAPLSPSPPAATTQRPESPQPATSPTPVQVPVAALHSDPTFTQISSNQSSATTCSDNKPSRVELAKHLSCKPENQESLNTGLTTPPPSSPSLDLSKSAPQIRSHITAISEICSNATSENLKNISKGNAKLKLSSSTCNKGFTSRTAATTPKRKSSSLTSSSLNQGTKLATAPAAGKRGNGGSRPTGSTISGRRLKAVRKLDFDVDTTSPVSGTIIKDAADFRPVSRLYRSLIVRIIC